MHNDFGEIIYRIILSILFSSCIGLEREFRQKMAGLRTHLLVGLGSTLVVLTNLHLYDIYKHETPIDPTRMMAGVITGIGFLCAGTIIKAGDSVRGLTTAATLWIASCIGISVGAGHDKAALAATVATLIVLTVVRRIEHYLSDHSHSEK